MLDDEDINDGLSERDAADEFLKRLLPQDDQDDLSDKGKDTKTPRASENEEDEEDKDQESDRESDESDESDEDSPGDEDDDGADDEGEKKYLDDDSVYIKHKVDGKEVEFAVKDLVRLAGQEASLTNRSKEVAETRKKLDEVASVHMEALDTLVKRANAKWEPFSKINFLALSKDPNISGEELASLQQLAQAAWEEKQFLEGGLGQFAKQVSDNRIQEKSKEASEAIKVLSGPVDKGGIEGWGEPLYNELMGFAVEQGVPKEFALELTDPAAFRIINMARMFAKGQAVVKTDKVKKGKSSPRKVIKESNNRSVDGKGGKANKAKEAEARVRRSGSVDDAAEAFLARWGAGADD